MTAVGTVATGDTMAPVFSGRAVARPTALAALLSLDWATGDDGAELTRKAVCQCGEAFTQRQLSARYLSLRSPSQLAALVRQCPAGWVPLNCGPCEHVQLGADAWRDEQDAKADVAAMRRRGLTAEDERYEKAERDGMASV